MSESVSGHWQQLKTSSKRECPKLFYNFSTANDGLLLHLTDLIALWRCSLDKFDIIAEAGRQQSSIDPAESTKQLNVLLSRLQQSIEEGKNTVFQDTRKNAAGYALSLRTVLNLPKPLKPLRWIFSLQPTPVSELSESILRPALHELSICHDKIKSLQSIIKDKDHVISKLSDRVSASSVDMSLIFPTLTGIAGRKGTVTVDDARDRIAGMATFNALEWENRFESETNDLKSTNQGLGNLVKGCEKCFTHTREEHEGWIARLPESITMESDFSQNTKASQSQDVRSKLTSQASIDGEDAFETATTPPNLKRWRLSPEPREESNDSTASEDDAGHSPSKRTKIGTIGRLGRQKPVKEKSRPKSSSPPAHEQGSSSPPTKRKASINSDATESPSPSDIEQEFGTRTSKPGSSRKKAEDASSKSLSPSTAGRPHHTSSGSHRLGKIGRARQRTASTSPVDDSKNANEQGRSTKDAPIATRKLGRLGTRNKPTESAHSSKEPSLPITRAEHNTSPCLPPNPTADNDHSEDSDATASISSRPTSPAPKPAAREPHNHNTMTSPRPKTEPQSSLPKKSASPAPTTETEEQATIRRREELKRTIQLGGGTKKKRRF